MTHYVIYDIEICKAIQKKGEPLEPDIEYCAGFHDFENMGIASIAAWSSDNNQMWFFMQDNMYEFERLIMDADIFIGFNNVKFDDRLLHHEGILYDPNRSRDVLRAVWEAKGLDPDEFNFKTHGGYSLADLAEKNLQQPKIGHGATAPIWYQRGDIGHLASYNIRDVELTRGLVNLIQTHGYLEDPKNPGEIIEIDQRYFEPVESNRI